ncbi:MAG: serine/threonine protein kinase [Rhodobiaceae bacterium]|nr:serine/threonine protein kinase [Rhodobiaceae bacterium]MCC0049936.1 serine/threonine protein kinase [Rhodobiaceae bacterium]
MLRRLNEAEANRVFPDPLPPAVLRIKAVLQNRLGLPENAILLLAEARQNDEADDESWKTSRELATVYAWRGDVDRANTELIRAMVEAQAQGRKDMLPLFLADAGRVCLERGDPETGALCFAAALGGMEPGEREQVRAAIGHIQCLNWIEDYAGARKAIDAVSPYMEKRNQRLRLLLAMEKARQCDGAGDAAGRAAALEECRTLLPEDSTAWEHVEFALVKFEVMQADGDAETDIDAMRDVVERLEEDQLYIQDAMVRLVLVDALQARGAFEEAIAEAAQALALAAKLGNKRLIYKARTALIELSDTTHAQDTDDLVNLPISARYIRASQLGKGGYGSVYKAVDTETGRMVAVKIISLSSVSDPGQREKRLADVRNELQASRAVSNPHVASVLETFVSDGELVLVQELIGGGELDEALVKSLDRTKLLTLLSQVAFGLAALHAAGIVHRDVKPQNVLVRGDGTPVIVDFGLAGLAGESEGETLRGTRDYMAPELIRSGHGRVYDPVSDAYAFGVMLRWALGEDAQAGGWFKRAFGGGGTGELVARLTEADPRKRLSDLAEAGRSLAGLAQAEGE